MASSMAPRRWGMQVVDKTAVSKRRSLGVESTLNNLAQRTQRVTPNNGKYKESSNPKNITMEIPEMPKTMFVNYLKIENLETRFGGFYVKKIMLKKLCFCMCLYV